MKTKVCVSIASDKPYAFSMVLSMVLMTKNFVSYVYGLPRAPICKNNSKVMAAKLTKQFIFIYIYMYIYIYTMIDNEIINRICFQQNI